MPKLLNGIAALLTIGFPFFIWFVGWVNSVWISLYLISIGVLGLSKWTIDASPKFEILFSIVPLTLGIAVFFFDPDLTLYYPVIINLLFILMFSSSLFAEKNIVQKIAEKLENNRLDQGGILYTRAVTIVWCCFFLANIIISLYCIFNENINLWTIYNGLISYLIMAGLFLVERTIRSPIKRLIMEKGNFDAPGPSPKT